MPDRNRIYQPDAVSNHRQPNTAQRGGLRGPVKNGSTTRPYDYNRDRSPSSKPYEQMSPWERENGGRR